MKSSIPLGRVFGIEVGLHYSWFLIALLITMSLSAQFQESHPEWGPGVIWTTALLTALLFFAALLAHELSHALVAREPRPDYARYYVVRSRWSGPDRERAGRSEDRVLGGNRRTVYQRDPGPDLARSGVGGGLANRHHA